MNKLLFGILNATLSAWKFRVFSICSVVFLSNLYLHGRTKKNVVGDHVKCVAKIKIHNIRYSAFIYQTAQKKMG